MSGATWCEEPYAIHVDSSAPALATQAREAGGVVIPLMLDGLRTEAELCDRIAESFAFPYPSRGLDGAMDFMSDLEWLEEGAGERRE